MTISFGSNYIEEAIALFTYTFRTEKMRMTVTPNAHHFAFKDATYLLEVRAWLAGAIACGLVTVTGVQVHE